MTLAKTKVKALILQYRVCLQWSLTIVITGGLYYKHTTIVNDASRVIRMTIVSDATILSVTYDRN